MFNCNGTLLANRYQAVLISDKKMTLTDDKENIFAKGNTQQAGTSNATYCEPHQPGRMVLVEKILCELNLLTKRNALQNCWISFS